MQPCFWLKMRRSFRKTWRTGYEEADGTYWELRSIAVTRSGRVEEHWYAYPPASSQAEQAPAPASLPATGSATTVSAPAPAAPNPSQEQLCDRAVPDQAPVPTSPTSFRKSWRTGCEEADGTCWELCCITVRQSGLVEEHWDVYPPAGFEASAAASSQAVPAPAPASLPVTDSGTMASAPDPAAPSPSQEQCRNRAEPVQAQGQ